MLWVVSPGCFSLNSSSFGGGAISLVVPGRSDSHSHQCWEAAQDQMFCPWAGLSLPSDRSEPRLPKVRCKSTGSGRWFSHLADGALSPI